MKRIYLSLLTVVLLATTANAAETETTTPTPSTNPMSLALDQQVDFFGNKKKAEQEKKQREEDDFPYFARGYHGMIDAGEVSLTEGLSDWSGLAVSTTHGFAFNPRIFTGLGIAYVSPFKNKEGYVTPYAAFRWHIMKRRVTPYLNARVGYTFGDLEGIYASAGIGVRFALARCRHGLRLCVGYIYQDGNGSSGAGGGIRAAIGIDL